MSTSWEPQEFFDGFNEQQQATLRTMLRAIKDGMERPKPYDIYRPMSAAPTRNLEAGMVRNADGTNWDPGSGAGLYRLGADLVTWNFLG